MKIPMCFTLLILNHFKVATSDNCFKSICIPSGYDKTAKPEINYEQDESLNFTNKIEVDFVNIQIVGMNERQSTITLKLSLWLWWEEPRITILPNTTQDEIDYLKDSGIYVPKEFINNLWLPDAYIENVHRINKFNLIHEYQTFYFKIYDDDESWFAYQNEVEIDMFCRMVFESYPLDEQICYFPIGSPKHLENSGQFFEHDWIKFNSSQQVALQGYRLEINPLPKDEKLFFDPAYDKHYQRTGFEIKFQHSFWKYLMSYYIPSGTLVIFSWVSEKINDKTTLVLR